MAHSHKILLKIPFKNNLNSVKLKHLTKNGIFYNRHIQHVNYELCFNLKHLYLFKSPCIKIINN